MAKHEGVDLWERQQGESTQAFEAFQIYRDMGASRSINAVASKLSKSRTLISRWSSDKNWVERCVAWDAEQDRIIRIQRTSDIRKMREKHANLANAMLVKAARALKSMPDEEIKASDISKFIEVASKLERISMGDVGEVVEERDGGPTEDRVQFYIPENGRDTGEDEDI